MIVRIVIDNKGETMFHLLTIFYIFVNFYFEIVIQFFFVDNEGNNCHAIP